MKNNFELKEGNFVKATSLTETLTINKGNDTWALKVSKEKGIEANPDLPIDEAAKAILKMVNDYLGVRYESNL